MFRQRSKGIIGDELLATLIVAVLLSIFIVSIVHISAGSASDRAFLDAQRMASALAEKLYFDASGAVSNPEQFVKASLPYPAKIVLTDTARNITWSSGDFHDARSVASASAAMLVVDGGRYYPARLEVLVPA